MSIYTFEDVGHYLSNFEITPQYGKRRMGSKLRYKEWYRYALQWYIDGFEQFFIDYSNGGIPTNDISIEEINMYMVCMNTEGSKSSDFDYYHYEFIDYNGKICRVIREGLYNPKFIDRSKIDNLYKDVLIWDSGFDQFNIKDKLVKKILRHRIKTKDGTYEWKEGLFEELCTIEVGGYIVKGYPIRRLGVFYVYGVVKKDNKRDLDFIKNEYKKYTMDSIKIDASKDIQKFIIERVILGYILMWLEDEMGYYNNDVFHSDLAKDIEKELKSLVEGNGAKNGVF
jgi:hypothetical protein